MTTKRAWWVVLAVAALVGLPVLFQSRPDRGYRGAYMRGRLVTLLRVVEQRAKPYALHVLEGAPFSLCIAFLEVVRASAPLHEWLAGLPAKR